MPYKATSRWRLPIFLLSMMLRRTYPAYFIKLAEPVKTVLTVADTDGNEYKLAELRTPPHHMTISDDTWASGLRGWCIYSYRAQ